MRSSINQGAHQVFSKTEVTRESTGRNQEHRSEHASNRYYFVSFTFSPGVMSVPDAVPRVPVICKEIQYKSSRRSAHASDQRPATDTGNATVPGDPESSTGMGDGTGISPPVPEDKESRPKHQYRDRATVPESVPGQRRYRESADPR